MLPAKLRNSVPLEGYTRQALLSASPGVRAGNPEGQLEFMGKVNQISRTLAKRLPQTDLTCTEERGFFAAKLYGLPRIGENEGSISALIH